MWLTLRMRPRRRIPSGALSRAVAAAAMGSLALGAISCGDEETLRPVDCALLCERYEACVEDIDGEACVIKCEQRASVSRVYGLSARSCQDCIEGKSCNEAAGCWDTCPVRVDD